MLEETAAAVMAAVGGGVIEERRVHGGTYARDTEFRGVVHILSQPDDMNLSIKFVSLKCWR